MKNAGVHRTRPGSGVCMRVVGEQDHEERGTEAVTDVASVVERGLFRSALEFYGAAGAVIEVRGRERPRISWDLDGLHDVRCAMGALERRIGIACRAGLSTERIVSITRLEPEVVELIVARQREDAAAPAR